MKRIDCRHLLSVSIVCLASTSPSRAAHAQRAMNASDGTRVYVERFSALPSNAVDDIAQFANKFIQLELSKAPQLRVISTATAPTCRKSAFPSLNSQAQPSMSPGMSYSVKGGVEGSPDSSYVLDVEVTRCENGVGSQVLHQSRLFRSRSATTELLGFAALVTDHIRTAGLPTVAVSVNLPPTMMSAQGPVSPLATLRDRVVSAIREVGVAQPIDTGAAEYAIAIAPQGAPLQPSGFRVRFSADRRLAGSIDVQRDQYNYSQLAAAVAQQTARRLAELIRTPDVAFATQRTAPVRDSALARAAEALCLRSSEPSCRSMPEVAMTALGSITNAQTDVDALSLRGMADLAAGKWGLALSELRRADSLRAAAPDSRRIPEATERNLHLSIAAVYRGAGNHAAAAREYERLALQSPRDRSVQLLLAQSLRLSGRRLQSLDIAARGMIALGDSALRQEAFDGVADITFNIVADSLPSLVTLCRRELRLQLVCASEFSERAAEASAAGEGMSRVRAVLNAAASLAGDNPRTRQKIALATASSYLGSLTYVDETPPTRFFVAGFEPDSVARYLSMVADTSGLTDSVRTTIHRVRANEAARLSRYLPAFNEARFAYRIRPNVDDALLATSIAMVLSSHASASPAAPSTAQFARQWNDVRLGVRVLIDEAIRTFPESEVLLTARARLCADYDPDPQCAYITDSLRLARGLLTSSADLLDAAEAAILSDHCATARQWLNLKTPEPLDDCVNSVRKLYEFWVASVAGGTGSDAFADWRRAVEKYRGQSARTCWIFRGARERLTRTPAPPRVALLLSMIDAHEHREVPLPSLGATMRQ